jgi:hypothetical protein
MFRRIGQKTPKKNRIIGQITTVLATASLVVAQSGVVDNKPLLKLGLQVLAGKLGVISLYNAQKVEQ